MMSTKNPELISSKTLLGTIGLLAFIFPIAVILRGTIFNTNCHEYQFTISAYYHTVSRDIFVGILCALAFAFLSYKGYDKEGWISDNTAANFASICALGVAFCPTSVSGIENTDCVKEINMKWIGTLHTVSAISLFITLAYFCIFQFTKSEFGSYWKKGINEKLSETKIKDNRVYITCGSLIVICILICGILFFCFDKNMLLGLAAYKPITILEGIMIWLFSLAWLHKSDYFELNS